jgi:Flp pilus assembly protein TadG
MEYVGFVSQTAMTSQRGNDVTDLRSRTQSGQILVAFVIAIIAIIAMVSLVIEGGNLFAQQRIAQNAADSTANAGTIVIAEKLSGAIRTGDDVAAAVAAASAANGLQNTVALYTDNFGVPLSPPVTVAPGTALPANARGVKATGNRVVDTSMARVIGINTLTASAEATAIAGAHSGGCIPDSPCTLLPVTVPITTQICDGSGRFTGIGGPGDLWQIAQEPLVAGNESILPLCKLSPGAVGWLDLGPGNLAQEISTPRGAIQIPAWVQTQPGNVNSVEGELNAYMGDIVLIPLFDGTCRRNPGAGSAICPTADQGVDPTTGGNNTWYHIPYLAAFVLDRAYVQGANVNACASAPGQPTVNPSSPDFLGCLKGWFVDYIYPGDVDPTATIDDSTVVSVQLIK